MARKNPDIAKSLEPLIKAEQRLNQARRDDAKLWRKEYDKLVEAYTKKHGKYPDSEDDHVISSKAYSKVGTPNWDSQIESYRTTGRDVVDSVLGEYKNMRLDTFNANYGNSVLRGYAMMEANRRIREEDERNKQ